MAQPKTAADELFRDLNALPFGGRVDPNDWNVKLLRKRIEQLAAVNRPAYFDLLGALSAVTWDVEEMRSYHEASIRLRPNEIGPYDNYACSLYRMGFFSEASKQIQAALRIAPEEAGLWRHASEVSLASGRIRLAHEQNARWIELAPDQQNAFPESPAASVAQAADLLAISDESAQLAVTIANKVLHRQGCYSVVASVGVLQSDELPIIDYLMGVPASCGVTALNVSLASELASADMLGDASANLVVRYVEAVATDANLTHRVA